jgi:hypothetical protein
MLVKQMKEVYKKRRVLRIKPGIDPGKGGQAESAADAAIAGTRFDIGEMRTIFNTIPSARERDSLWH